MTEEEKLREIASYLKKNHAALSNRLKKLPNLTTRLTLLMAAINYLKAEPTGIFSKLRHGHEGRFKTWLFIYDLIQRPGRKKETIVSALTYWIYDSGCYKSSRLAFSIRACPDLFEHNEQQNPYNKLSHAKRKKLQAAYINPEKNKKMSAII
jgi:hypothetical protein